MSDARHAELDKLLTQLRGPILVMHAAWMETTDALDLVDEARDVIIVAGQREGVRRVVPEHDGAARFAVAIVQRPALLAQLRALGERQAAAELDRARVPGRVEVLLTTATWLAVVNLEPAGEASDPFNGGPLQ